MHNLRSSAAYRIAFAYSAAFALAIMALGLIVYFAADAAFRGQQDASIAKESADIVQSYRDEGMSDLIETVNGRGTGSATNGFGYALFDRMGRRIAGQLATARPAIGWANIQFLDPEEGPDPARALATALPEGRMLVVAIDTQALEQIDRTILSLFGAAFALVVIVGGAGAFILGGYLQRRLERISDTADAIVAGDMQRRIPIGSRGDEFDRLARSLNGMLDRIAQLLVNLRQVSTDIAHDLRTPLARLRGGIEAAIDGPSDPDVHLAAFERALEQSDDLLTLFTAILHISELEEGGLTRRFQPVDLSGLVSDLCEVYAPAIIDDGRDLQDAIEPAIWVRGDRNLIAQAIINLLENAQNHTPQGTKIGVALRAIDGTARLTVADDGPGVAAEDRTRILQRFVRLESSRTTPGHGLGLNLVAAVIAAHGGTLKIGGNRPGLRVTMVLPTVAAEA